MNVFVTGTGRCGTVTFSKAAAHATNYTVGHETKAGALGDLYGAWSYQPQHIEVSAQLVIAIPILKRRYPGARWVHLIRNRRDCVESQATQCAEAINAFGFVYFQTRNIIEEHLHQAAASYYDLTVSLIDTLLPEAFRLELEHVKRDWRRCWEFMGCKGDFAQSLEEWDHRYNARPR